MTEDLGADESTLALVAAGIVVIVVAPIAEEFFFRGFFYRALRSRLGILSAAAIDGLVFGLIHFTGLGHARAACRSSARSASCSASCTSGRGRSTR